MHDKDIKKKNRWMVALTSLAAGILCLNADCPPIGGGISDSPTTHNINARYYFSTTTVAPTIDGIPDNDPGWAGIPIYRFEYRTTDSSYFCGAADNDNIYFTFKIKHDRDLTQYDAIVLCLDPTGIDADKIRLHIFPFYNVGALASSGNTQFLKADGTNPNPGTFGRIEYSKGYAAGTNSWTSVATLTGCKAAVAWASAAGDNTWAVELSLPKAAFNIPATNYFGLYCNIVRTDLTTSDAEEFTWPPEVPLTSSFLELDAGTPLSSLWGNGSLRPWGNGVSIYAEDITTNQTPSNDISLNHPNYFYARVHNNSWKTNGGLSVYDTARGVIATFKLSNWGMPSAWQPLGSMGPTDIRPTLTDTFQIGPWSAPGGVYNTDSTKHQCIRVELTSSNPNTVFLNTSAMQNMTFVTTSSPFDASAYIGVQGYRPAKGSEMVEIRLREFVYNTTPNEPWAFEYSNIERTGEHDYLLRTPANKDVFLKSRVTPPKLDIPDVETTVIPAADGKTKPVVGIPLSKGPLVTVVAEGYLTYIAGADTFFVGPSGVKLPVKTDNQSSMRPNPNQEPTGALYGWFNTNPEKQFYIGSAATLQRPYNADTLFVVIKGITNKKSDEGYKIQVTQSINREGQSPAYNKDDKYFGYAPLGSNLPSWTLYGSLKTGNQLKIKDKTFNVYKPIGYYGYIVRKIGH